MLYFVDGHVETEIPADEFATVGASCQPAMAWVDRQRSDESMSGVVGQGPCRRLTSLIPANNVARDSCIG